MRLSSPVAILKKTSARTTYYQLQGMHRRLQGRQEGQQLSMGIEIYALVQR
jgi:hypothetical protein